MRRFSQCMYLCVIWMSGFLCAQAIAGCQSDNQVWAWSLLGAITLLVQAALTSAHLRTPQAASRS